MNLRGVASGPGNGERFVLGVGLRKRDDFREPAAAADGIPPAEP